MTNDSSILSSHEAADRVRADHDALFAELAGRTDEGLREPFRVEAGPLGDFCDSLHDLVAHVLMWDEIDLSVLSEARAGREHWSLAPRWETSDVGRRLNLSGVMAGRELPAQLLVHRLTTVRDALLDELDNADRQLWASPGRSEVLKSGLGPLMQRAMTVPGSPPYWHAALHLRQLPVLAARG